MIRGGGIGCTTNVRYMTLIILITIDESTIPKVRGGGSSFGFWIAMILDMILIAAVVATTTTTAAESTTSTSRQHGWSVK